MGLDQYAYRCKLESLSDKQVDFENPDDASQFFYWRKHPDLQGWMRNLYLSKGGKDEEFNCSAVRLDLSDLTKLEDTVKKMDLPHTTGFFFGTSDGYEEVGNDLDFVKQAKQIIEDGGAVFYTSWW